MGKDVFGESYSWFGGTVRFSDAPYEPIVSQSEVDTEREDGAELFLDTGINISHLQVELGDEAYGIQKFGPMTGIHIGLGARRATGAHHDLGVRAEADEIDGHLLLAVRALDYRYRAGRHLAYSLFLGAARYSLATPAYGLYLGVGTQWRDLLPRWDLNLDLRYGDAIARDKVLPGEVAGYQPDNFYDLVGSTPLANDYEFEFARELITYEKLGNGPATDLLILSLSANDILGHKVGPDSPEMQAMALATDRQLAGFFEFLGHQIGLANMWIALSADHGLAPLPKIAAGLRLPAANITSDKIRAQVNSGLSARLAHPAEYVKEFDYPVAWLNPEAFAAVKVSEQDAERDVGEALKQAGLRAYYTRFQLERGDAPNTELGLKYLHSYSPLAGWYVLGVPPPFTIGFVGGTDHATPYNYDTHVPLAFYGLPFQTGTYRTRAEPVDLVPTLASLLGINAPTHSIGRVLTEMLVPARRGPSSSNGGPDRNSPAVEGRNLRPASDGFISTKTRAARMRTTTLQVGGPR